MNQATELLEEQIRQNRSQIQIACKAIDELQQQVDQHKQNIAARMEDNRVLIEALMSLDPQRGRLYKVVHHET